ncbi:MAG: response regulator transcription factor [Eubacteriaceae bacterium]|nr:response regulator transcription factor [Eubacteriaceae bacterium]
MYKIMLVDDDNSILDINSIYLQRQGHEVVTAASIKEAREILANYSPDLMVLDVMLPDGSGLKFCQEIKKDANFPVIFLSSLCKEDERIDGFISGGDDYMTKPFSPRELSFRIIARIKNSLSGSEQPKILVFGDLAIDTASKSAMMKGNPIDLTAKEFNILLQLARNIDRTYSLDDIYTAVWGMYDGGDPRTIQTHVFNLRKKLKDANKDKTFIKTVWGRGYKFNDK